MWLPGREHDMWLSGREHTYGIPVAPSDLPPLVSRKHIADIAPAAIEALPHFYSLSVETGKYGKGGYAFSCLAAAIA